MSNYWKGDWPNLNSVSIALEGVAVNHLTASEIGILYRLVWFVAAQCVHTQFSGPADDPHVPEDRAHIVAGCGKSEWRRALDRLSPFFKVSNGKLRLKDHSCIRLSRDTQRSPLPANVRAIALRRDGERCAYCGEDKGPFHFDHLWPVAKGGSDEPSNIVLACVPCNLSKSDKTLAEWMSSR